MTMKPRPALRAFLLPALLLAAPLADRPASAQGVSGVTLTVTDLRSDRGQLLVCLYDTSENFPGCEADAGVPRRVVPVTGRTMQVTLPIPAAGRYAVVVVHDENGNGRMGHNFIGMPTEGVGVSNNRGGMPRFNSSVVSLAPGGTVSVGMHYLFG